MRYLSRPAFPTVADTSPARDCCVAAALTERWLRETAHPVKYYLSISNFSYFSVLTQSAGRSAGPAHRQPCKLAGRKKAAPMDHAAIMAKLEELMVDVFDVDDLVVTETTSADDVEEWDSLSHIRFMITVERFFKIRFLNEEVADLKNIGDLARTIAAKLG
jgi:acyl carrier protein